jgi:hypothetical protein
MAILRTSPGQAFVRAAKKPVWHAWHRLTGRRMALPVRFLDMRMVGGVFSLPPHQAQQLVAHDRFVPWVADDGQARCHVTALEYRKVDILYPYNELAVMIPGSLRGVDRETPLHAYLHLPVTTEDARWTGVEIYGFPKYLATIDFREAEHEVVSSLELVGREALALRVTKGPARDDDWMVYNLTFLDGEPMLSTFHGTGQRYTSDFHGGARLRWGEHEMVQGLRSAQIELTSVSHFYCPRMRATLSTPIKLKDVAE